MAFCLSICPFVRPSVHSKQKPQTTKSKVINESSDSPPDITSDAPSIGHSDEINKDNPNNDATPEIPIPVKSNEGSNTSPDKSMRKTPSSTASLHTDTSPIREERQRQRQQTTLADVSSDVSHFSYFLEKYLFIRF